ncbi:MAG TPA: heme biosynthesis HemY N-terminal domain-containing protein [Macromonas sp.]|nr:heme biosynthesis HemY N-terminal domain-containing protein [Macromonas sp.]
MKNVFGFLFLTALAVALALLVGGNSASVTLFWSPYRVDLSFNLFLVCLLLVFVLLYFAVRTWGVLRRLPAQAQRWRLHQLERAMHGSLLEALSYLMSGRFVRARSSAQRALNQLEALSSQDVPTHAEATVLAHWLLAESAVQLGDTAMADHHTQTVIDQATPAPAIPAREGLLLRAAAWSVEARDAESVQRWLNALPQGAMRRIQAQRVRLRLAQMQRDTQTALEAVRLLTKHHAFSPRVAASVLRGLIQDALKDTHDSDQLVRVWLALDADERSVPELALAMLDRWQVLSASGAEDESVSGPLARRTLEQCLQTVWDHMDALSDDGRRRLVRHLESLLPQLESGWLAQIERRQQARPADVYLQYLAGQAYMQRQLWGKAAFLLGQASHGLRQPELLRRAWCSQARLAEERGDEQAAQAAWKKAALIC